MLDFLFIVYSVGSIFWLDPDCYTGVSFKYCLWLVGFVLILRKIWDIAMSAGIFSPLLTHPMSHVH